MYKRLMTIAIAALMLLSMAVPAFATDTEAATTLTISNGTEFLQFAENCRLDAYSKNLQVSLEKDIDLTGLNFSGIPIFSGCFDGKNHTISGISLTHDGSMQGLFRYLTADAIVQNLSLVGEIHPGGSRNEIGAIVGRNEGQILNCSFSGTVSGSDYVGGIAGTNAITGIIDNCRISGDLHGDHFVGGIAGENLGVIRNCTNQALINTTPQQNSIEISDITIDTLTNTESANTVTDIGGIAGISSGVISKCKNLADIGYQHMGYNIGGIAGTQSGYLAECENSGKIQGRKEVGGIVGQMEPASLIEYAEDTLQILKAQLGSMSGLVNQASNNAQTNTNKIIGQIGVLEEQTETALDAVETLLPDTENPSLPDQDTILAAQNTLTQTLTDMPKTLRSIVSATQNTVNALTKNLNAISAQLGAMGETVNHASEHLRAEIADVSDQDTEELLTCKVENCINTGTVLADLNVGGIAGAISMENDLDVLEDWGQNGEESLNLQVTIRAVILNCTNSGTITGVKQNVGGIVGGQLFGLIRDSVNTGRIQGENADYVGGITGLSTGYIRNNQVKAEISGKTYVGGIAGSATIVTDSLAQVKFSGGNEKMGAVLGFAEKTYTDVTNPIAGNFYLPTEQDSGAIDGISYAGIAEPKTLADVESLPELFRTVTIRFLAEDKLVTEIRLHPGESLTASKIPAVPAKDGFAGLWDGLKESNLENILFDMTFDAVYTAHSAVIQAEFLRENGRPLVLAEGSFTNQAVITASASSFSPTLDRKESLLESWTITLNEQTETIRILLPEEADAEQIVLYVSESGDSWENVPFTVDGSYLVLSPAYGNFHLAIAQEQSNPNVPILTVVGAAAAVALYLILKKRKK